MPARRRRDSADVLRLAGDSKKLAIPADNDGVAVRKIALASKRQHGGLINVASLTAPRRRAHGGAGVAASSPDGDIPE